MTTKTINIYEFDELSEKAQKKAHDNFKDNDLNDLSYDLQIELDYDLDYLLEENNIICTNRSPKIYYSLTNSQGDGVCFTGDYTYDNQDIKITYKGRYNHEYSTDIEGQFKSEVKNREFLNLYYSICKQLEKHGYSFLDDQNTIEYFIEHINSNDIVFTEEGNTYQE